MDLSSEEKAQQEPLPSSVTESLLFKLPPELRNEIYRYAIISNRDLPVTKSHGIPDSALLSVSKLVRFEAYEIFYRENVFTYIAHDYDPATLILGYRKLSGRAPFSSVRLKHYVTSHIHCSGTRCWKNLVTWFHLAHQGVCYGLVIARGDNPELNLLSGLFEMAMYGPRITTSALDFLLKSMWPVFVNLNQEWDED